MRDQCSVPIAGENSQVRGEAVALAVGSRKSPIWHIRTGNAGLICCLTWVVCVQMWKDRLLRKGEEFKSDEQTRAEDVCPAMQWGRENSSQAVKWWRTGWKKAQKGNFDYTEIWWSELGQLRPNQVLVQIQKEGQLWDQSTGQRAWSTNFVPVSSTNSHTALDKVPLIFSVP